MTATECQRRGGRGRGDSCSSICKHCILRVFERRRDGSDNFSFKSGCICEEIVDSA